MKFKNKKAKNNNEEPGQNAEYPEERNPFASAFQESNGKANRDRTTSDAAGLKGKKKNIKKEPKEAKKTKKPKGKRERALSRAVTSQIANEGDAMRSRVPTIVVQDERGVDVAPTSAKKSDKKEKKERKKKKKEEKKKEKQEKKGKKRGEKIEIPVETHSTLTEVDRKPAGVVVTAGPGKSPAGLSAPPAPTNRLRELRKESPKLPGSPGTSSYSSLPSAGKKKAEMAKATRDNVKRHSTGDLRQENEKAQNADKPASGGVPGRPGLSLPVGPSGHGSGGSRDPLSPIVESPVAPQAGPSRPARNRTASVVVSSRERRKKKRLRLKKKLKRMKGKKDKENEEDLPEDFNPIHRGRAEDPNQVEVLRDQVEEVKTIMVGNMAEEMEKRSSALFQLAQKTDQLEEFSHQFATVAQETRLKKQAQARCCGAFSKYRFCWYLCACQRRVKRRKRKARVEQEGVGENGKLLSRAFADDARYDVADDAYSVANSEGVVNRRDKRRSQQLMTSSNPSLAANSTKRSSNTSLLVGLKNSMIYASLSALPIMGTMKTVGRSRKASSSGTLNQVGRVRAETRTQEQKERDIHDFASKYEGEDRNRVTELLMLDHIGT